MNNNDNNNNSQETNDGLSVISLGNVGNINPTNNIPTIDSSSSSVDASNGLVSETGAPVGESVKQEIVEAPVPLDEASQNLGVVKEEEKSSNPQTVAPDNNVESQSANEVVAPVNSVAVENTASSIPTNVEPVAPLDYEVPATINNFDPTPVFNNIGTVPPIPDIPVVDPALQAPKEKKKGMPKPLFVLIVILALGVVGVGVYVFLHKSNILGPSVIPKSVKVEIGSKLSTNITDYATFSGIDSSTCSLNVQDIPSELKTLNAEYTFRIICNEASFSGKLTVVDTIAPEVTLKDVEVAIDAEVKPEDFIEECKDSTKCSYAFKDEEKVKGNLKEAASYHVDLIIKDEAGNEVTKTAKMIVSDVPTFEEADMYLSCTLPEKEGIIENVKIGIVDGEYKKTAVLRRYTFKLEASLYETLKAENEGKLEMTYNNITGKPEFNGDLLLSVPVSYDNFKAEIGDLPSDIVELRTYLTDKGYKCDYEYE